MAAHRSPGFLGRFLAARRNRAASRRRDVQELRDEREHQARIVRWKGHRRWLAARDQPMSLAGPMPQRPPSPQPRRSPSGYDQES